MNFKQVFENKARRLEGFAGDQEREERHSKALINYCKAIPLYCEASILSKIYGDNQTSDRCIQKALEIAKKIENSRDNYANSTCYYAKAIDFAFKGKYSKSAEYLEKAKKISSNTYIHDPLFISWIYCELAYCHSKLSDFDYALYYYLVGYKIHKLFEIENQHLDIIRRYLHHAILSKFKFLDDRDILYQIEKIAEDLTEHGNMMASIYYAELAILHEEILEKSEEGIKGPILNKRDQYINKAEGLAQEFKSKSYQYQSIINYIEGVKCGFQNKFSEARIELEKAENLIEERTIDDLIYSVLLSRERSFCMLRLLDEKDIAKNNLKLEDLYSEPFMKIENLEWEIDLHFRTLGVFYSFIGTIQFHRWNWGNKSPFKSTIKVEASSDPVLDKELKKLERKGLDIINSEILQLHDPLFAFKNSLKYVKIVKDNVLMAFLYLSLSQTYSKLRKDYTAAREELKKASDYLSKASDVDDEHIKDYLWAMYYHASASLAQELKDYESAMLDYEKALEIAKKEKNREHQAIILNNMTKILLDKNGDFKKAEEYCKRGISLSVKENFNLLLVYLYCNLAKIFVREKRNYTDARSHLTLAKKKAKDIGSEELIEYVEDIEKWVSLNEKYPDSLKALEAQIQNSKG